ILATAFYLGFGNLISDDPDTFKTIDVGYVNTNQEETNFSKMLAELEKDSDSHEQVLNVRKYASKNDALKAMTEDEVSGIYIEAEGEIETIVPKNGYESTTLNQIAREYENKLTLIETVAKDHPENLQTTIDMVTNDLQIMKQHDFGTNTSPYLQYFFALIGMASLFSSWISTSMLEGMCANITEQGKRFECAPTSKLMAIMAGILAGLTLQSVSNAIVVLYIQYVLKISLGAPLWNIILITTIGSGLGISAGVFIGSLIKDTKLLIVVPLCFTMTCSFCSGLMWHQIRQIIEANFPIFNRINPAALLVDCLYTRATYGKTAMYYQDLMIMGSMIAGCLIISAFLLRRRKYVSI
ncbi:MAG: ABC transporter permease, partial [Pseudobutyrivibrio sp.]|nr:ABC transporter permease [Pseudobutyrivibrio sp.]